MSDILQVPVPNGNAASCWGARGAAGVDSLLFINQDLNNTVWIGQQSIITPGSTNTIPIPPNGTFSGSANTPWYVVGSVAGIQPLVVVPNGQGFFLGLTQGLGKLAIPQIMSPNFNLADPSDSPSPSWAILKSGLAYFVGLALSGGTITGPDYIINSTGEFFYSGTPTVGNLLFSNTQATVDPVGNPTIPGLTSYNDDNLFALNISNTGLQGYYLSGGVWLSTGVSITFPFNSAVPTLQFDGQNFSFGQFNNYNIIIPSGDTSGNTDTQNIDTYTGIGDTYLAPGNWYINETVGPSQGTKLICSPGAVINAVAGGTWTNNMMGIIVHNYAEIEGGQWNGLGATSATAIGGVGIYGAQHCRIDEITGTNLSWWTVESQGSAATANLDLMVGRVISRNCAAGVHYQGVSGSSFHSENFGADLQIQQCGAATGAGANMDALFIEDAEDILISSVNSGMVAGSGNNLHIKGACATVHITNADIGGGANAVCLVENNAGGTGPQDIWVNGTLQQSSAGYGLRITGVADELHFKCRFFRNWLSGASIEGSGDSIDLHGSVFANNNQSAGANYDLVVTASTIFYCASAQFRTPIGTSTAGQVPSPVNDTTHKAVLTDCAFIGSGTTAENVFASGGTPQIVRNCIGANPRGQITAPTITTGTFTTNTSQYDTEVIFLTLGGMTSFSINGTVTGVLAAVGVPYHIPARSTLIVTSATTAPTWQWYAD